MPRTISRSYRTFEDARNVVVRLSEIGIPPARIGLIGHRQGGDDNAAAGAGIGGAAGAATGFVLGLGALSLPGVGAVIAAGWFLTTAAAGALAGGVIGALVDFGVPEPEASRHGEELGRGSALVAVQVEPDEAARAVAIMEAGLPIGEGQPQAGEGSGGADPRDLSKIVS
jgi:hypothetical protein